MKTFALDEQRCLNCDKLLFRGLVGIGFIEVKCTRCGHVNMLNSYDIMLRSTPGAYILVYGGDGRIIATSKSAESILGYDAAELTAMHITDIDKSFRLPSPQKGKELSLDAWEQHHESLPMAVTHHHKDGTTQQSNARYYPIGSYSGVYTIGIFYGAHR